MLDTDWERRSPAPLEARRADRRIRPCAYCGREAGTTYHKPTDQHLCDSCWRIDHPPAVAAEGQVQ